MSGWVQVPVPVRRAGRLAVLAALLGMLTVLTALVLVPRLGDAATYTVLTRSMEPTMTPGTMVVVRPVDPGSIEAGDVITYQLRSGSAEVVTHRVVAVEADEAGEPVFFTQGDANDGRDPDPVLAVQVRGALWYSVPHVGHLTHVATPDVRQLAVNVLTVLLGCYAVAMFGLEGRAVARRHPGLTARLPGRTRTRLRHG